MIQMIDIHAHILPGTDDGPQSMEESVKLLEMAASQGVVGVIATPHYSRHGIREGLEELAWELQQRIEAVIPGFRIWLGQETYYHEELASRLKAGVALSLAGSRYVLVEFDPCVSYRKLYRGVRRLLDSGWSPVLAHMERYGCLRQTGAGELLSCGCKLQMNYEGVAGHWYDAQTRWCRRQIEEGNIHLLATDMHRLDYRPPETKQAFKWLEKHISPEYIERMVYLNPLHIIKKEKF